MTAPTLVPLQTVRADVVKSVVETLEALLEDAKAGRVVCVAIGFATADGAVNTAISRSDDVGRLMGAVSLSEWLTAQIGMPVDFKFQPMSWANAHHSGPRQALGLRMVSPRDRQT